MFVKCVKQPFAFLRRRRRKWRSYIAVVINSAKSLLFKFDGLPVA